MRLIARDPSQMVNAGYPSLAHIPFLIGNDGTYPAIANRYIRVRALCEWTLQMGNDSSPSSDARRRFLTKASVNSVARHVGAFLDWCNSTGRDWQKLTYYEDLILGWQDGLLTGQSSKSQRPLAHKTVNKMVTEACYFLTWAGEEKRSLRPPFHVVVNETKIKFSRGTNAKGAGVKVNASRVGALPVKEKKPVLLPPPNDVGTWMRGMRARYTAKALMAELILETGIRVSECNEWRVDTLPERQFWQTRGGKIVVNLRYGIKGPKVALGSSESVNPREIEMPIALADKIDHCLIRQSQ
jgi:hypothetical protein